jgi:hypothetical protein
MADEQIVKYLRENLAKGYSAAALRNALLKSGASSKDVEEAFKEVQGGTSTSEPTRPGVVGIFCAITLLSFAYGIYASPLGELYGASFLIAIALISFSAILTFLFIFNFFTLTQQTMTWLYVYFGYSLLISAVGMQWVNLVLILVYGAIVWDYVKHKQIDGKALFSRPSPLFSITGAGASFLIFCLCFAGLYFWSSPLFIPLESAEVPSDAWYTPDITTAAFSTYIFPNLPYQFQYPSEWSIEESENKVRFISPRESEYDSYLESFMYQVGTLSAEEALLPPSEVFDAFANQFLEGGYSLASSLEIPMENSNARNYIFTATIEGAQIQADIMVIISNGAFSLTGTFIQAEKMESFTPFMDNIKNSFVVF